MKRQNLLVGFALAGGLLLGALNLPAQDSTKTGPKIGQEQRGAGFIDENGNGNCDRFENGTPMGRKGRHFNGNGPNFVDENGDGICDNRGAGMMGKGHRGRGQHRTGFGMKQGR